MVVVFWCCFFCEDGIDEGMIVVDDDGIDVFEYVVFCEFIEFLF